MEGKYFRNLGLPMASWQAVESAKESPICRELFGRYPSDSQVVGWLMKLGMAYLCQLEAKEVEKQDRLAHVEELTR